MKIDVVIIGLNSAKTLGECIESALASRLPEGHTLRVIYVDSGSTDASLQVAAKYPGVLSLVLETEHPSPGAARNLGWTAGDGEFVQFLDSDTVMDPDWIVRALAGMVDGVGAVRGWRKEREPERSCYNWIADQEWNSGAGECDTFGGDALIRREVLERTGGYDEELVGGEDPELSERVRRMGWKVMQLDVPMTVHDLAMTKASQYWKRAYRTGYGYAAVLDRHSQSGFWRHEAARICIRGGLGTALVAVALPLAMLIHPVLACLALLGLFLVFYPRVLRWKRIGGEKGMRDGDAKRYAMHCSLVVVPEFFGMVRFAWGKLLSRPLRNSRRSGGIPCGAHVCALLVLGLGLFGMSGCITVNPGIYDYTKGDRKASREGFNWDNQFHGDEEKAKVRFASEAEIETFSNAGPKEYLIGPGDVLSVTVRDRPDVSLLETTVSPDGFMVMPRLGMIKVQGKTVGWLMEHIQSGLAAYYERPDVAVHVREFNNNKVFVLGRVDKPGVVHFQGTGTLLEAISMAGGMSTVAQNSFLSQAVIFRGKEMVIWVDLKALLNQGNMALNAKLQNNDLIFIPESHDELVYVMGEVKNPGAVKLTSELSVLDLIMTAGGMTEHALANKVYLIRYKDGRSYVQQIRVDRFLASGDLRQDFTLQDGDIVYVSCKPLHQINYVITELSPAMTYLDLASSFRRGTEMSSVARTVVTD